MAQAAFVLAGVSALASIYGGFQEKKAYKEQAALQRDQAVLAVQEAEEEAARREEERDRLMARQRVSFLANGVKLNGSPLAVLDDTAYQYNKEIKAIRRRGVAESNFMRREARILEDKGRAAVLRGFTQAAGTVASSGTQTGVFK